MKTTKQSILKTFARSIKSIMILFAMSIATLGNAQQSYMKAYNGAIATITGGQTVGQTFVIDDSFPSSADTFTFFEIYHQTPWNSKFDLKIYEGTDLKATPRYSQENISVPKVTESNKLFKIELKGGVGNLSFKKGKRYTVTFTMKSNFRWSGDKLNPIKSTYAYWPNNGGMWQKSFSYFYNIGTKGEGLVSGQKYMINSVMGGLYLDADGHNLTKNGAKVQMWTKNSHDNQKWILEEVGKNTYMLKCVMGGLYLDADGYSLTKNGGKVQMWKRNANDNQKWIFEKVGNNTYMLKSAMGGLYLDADGYSLTKNGGKVQMWKRNAHDNQKWVFTPVN